MSQITCKVCSRPLLSLESVDRGVGPMCTKHIPYQDLAKIQRKHVKYWIIESYEDISTAYFLKKSGQRKLESAFFSHLATEKAIKALVAQHTDQIPPKIHDLIELSKRAELSLSEEQEQFLSMLNGYEIEGRYPVERQKLLSRTSDQRFEEILEKASEFIQWCTQKIN